MKNKRQVYLLLPLVVLVWGLIAQRIWFATMASEPEEGPAAMLPAAGPAAAQRHPTLLLSYADPFQPLGLTRRSELPGAGSATREPTGLPLPRPRAVVAASLNLPLAPAAVPAPPVVWPQVKYLGLITNSRINSQVVLLTIDNQELLVKAGQSSHGIQLVRAFRDSIQVSFNKQKRSFYRATSPPYN